MVFLQSSFLIKTSLENYFDSFNHFHSTYRHDAKTHAVKMRIVLLTRMEELTVDADQVLEGKTNIQMLFAQVSQIYILMRLLYGSSRKRIREMVRVFLHTNMEIKLHLRLSF